MHISKKNCTFAPDFVKTRQIIVYNITRMKKFFLLMALAVMTASIVFNTGCNPNAPTGPGDNPDANDTIPAIEDPGKSEWFEDQIVTHDSVKVDLKIENIYGIWRLYAEASSLDTMYSTSSTIVYEEDGKDQQYLQLNEDKTCLWYRIQDNQPNGKIPGTWNIIKDSIQLISDDPNNTFPYGNRTAWISALEKEKFVFAYVDHNFGGSKETHYQYYIFRRIDKMPEVPVSMYERLMANPWKIVYDLKQTVKNGEVVNAETGLTPLNAILTFGQSETGHNPLAVKNNKGEVTNLIWATEVIQDSILRMWIMDGEGHPTTIDKTCGLVSGVEFKPDFKDNTKAALEVKLDENGMDDWNWPDKNLSSYTRYFYQLEAVEK